jgi:hypothetical protein
MSLCATRFIVSNSNETVEAGMQVDVKIVLNAQLRFALPMAGASDASMQVTAKRVL